MKRMESRIQTILRLDPELMDRVKRRARKEKVSFNRYVEQLLERESRPSFPTLPPDFKVSEEIAGLALFDCGVPDAGEMASDPKLAYLWEKYGKA